MPDFSLIIPAHNESENLAILLPKLQKELGSISYEIIVVDNASTDSTQQTLQYFLSKIENFWVVSEPQLGYGRAVIAGLKAASGSVLGTIRADNQEKAEDLVWMYRFLLEKRLDLCKAIRKSRKNDGLQRILISKAYNFLFKVLFDLRYKDVNASPKLLSRAFYNNANLESSDWFIDAEILIKADKMGYQIGEVAIDYLPRLKGKSTVRLRHILEFLSNMLTWYQRVKNGKLLERQEGFYHGR